MKSFRDILAEAAVKTSYTVASPADGKKLAKILNDAEVSFKQKGEVFQVHFEDKLQKEIVSSAIKNDRKIKFK